MASGDLFATSGCGPTVTSAFQHALVRLDDEGNIVEWSCAQCGELTQSAKSMSLHLQSHKRHTQEKLPTTDAVNTKKQLFKREIGQGDGPNSKPPVLQASKPVASAYGDSESPLITVEIPASNEVCTPKLGDPLVSNTHHITEQISQTIATASTCKLGETEPEVPQHKRQKRKKGLYALPVIVSPNKKQKKNMDNYIFSGNEAANFQIIDGSDDVGSNVDIESDDVIQLRNKTLDKTKDAEEKETPDYIDLPCYRFGTGVDDGVQTLQCPTCDWKTQRHFSYHRHILSHSAESQIECTYCSKTIGVFMGKSSCVEKQYKCGKCARMFERKAALHKHRRAEHGETTAPQFVCFMCLDAFHKLKDLKAHLGENHAKELSEDPKLQAFQQDKQRYTINEKGDDLICSFCEWKSDRHFNYHRHVLRHCLSNQNYVCPYCCKHITPDTSSTGYGVSTFSCAECSHVSYTKCHLSTHQYLQHGIAQLGALSCSICKYRCTSKKLLLQHHEIAHADCTFLMNESTVQALNHAQPQLDADEKEYKCEKCGYTCNRHDTLKKHVITHVPEQHRTVFKCDFEDCGFETYSEISLNVHASGKHKRQERALKRNQLAVIYTCDMCGHFNTPSEERLFLHQATTCYKVSPEDAQVGKKDKLRAKRTRAPSGCCIKYSCNQCKNFMASRRWNMIRHKETAHGNCELMNCAYCDYNTKHRKLMFNHYTKAHLMQLPDNFEMTLPDKDGEQQLVPDNGMRGLYTVCTSKKSLSTRLKAVPDIAIESCRECGKRMPSYQLNKHMTIVHNYLKTFRCHVTGCDYHTATATMLTSHVRQQHVTNLVETGDSKDGASYTCVWQCGYTTPSSETWHLHNRENCRLRDSTKSWDEYRLLCKEQEDASAHDAQLPAAHRQHGSDFDDVLSNAMRSITEITRAMKASGIEKPVIQQQGKTIYITVDKEDILKKKLKEELLGLNEISSTGNNNLDKNSSQIQYIIKTSNEKDTELQDITTSSNLSMEQCITVENSHVTNPAMERYNIIQNVIMENSETVNTPLIVENNQTVGNSQVTQSTAIVENLQNSRPWVLGENYRIMKLPLVENTEDQQIIESSLVVECAPSIDNPSDVATKTEESVSGKIFLLPIESGNSSENAGNQEQTFQIDGYEFHGRQLTPEVLELLTATVDKPP